MKLFDIFFSFSTLGVVGGINYHHQHITREHNANNVHRYSPTPRINIFPSTAVPTSAPTVNAGFIADLESRRIICKINPVHVTYIVAARLDTGLCLFSSLSTVCSSLVFVITASN